MTQVISFNNGTVHLLSQCRYSMIDVFAASTRGQNATRSHSRGGMGEPFRPVNLGGGRDRHLPGNLPLL